MTRTEADKQACLVSGAQNEDFVTMRLWEAGIVCIPHRSSRYQWKYGENFSGIEIKNDLKFRSTGNLYIETRERSTSDYEWHPAGVFYEPRPRLFAIGDRQTIYLLAVTYLLGIMPKCETTGNRTDTAKGFLLPVRWAQKWAVDILESTEEAAF